MKTSILTIYTSVLLVFMEEKIVEHAYSAIFAVFSLPLLMFLLFGTSEVRCAFKDNK